MKNLFKSIGGLATAALLVSALVANAQPSVVVVTNLTTATTNVILTNGGYYISEIDVAVGSINSGNASAAQTGLVTFYDCNTNTLQYSNTNSYVTKSELITNVTSVLTNNSTGQVYTNIYPGTWTIFTTNTGFTNVYPPISVFSLTANSLQRRTGQHISVMNGLTATVNPNVATTNLVPTTVTLFYSPNF